jgi:Flp pilus assembly protein TadD
LASALAVGGRVNEALPHFAAARKLLPDDATVAADFGVALAMSGQMDAAIVEFNEALRLQADFPSAQANLAKALNSLGRASEAVAHYREVLERHPLDRTAAAALSWLLATHADEQIRNGADALAVIEPLASAATQDDAIVLNSLAAAYAELGRFDEAVRAAQRARDAARKANQLGLARQCEQQAEEYRQRRPHREPVTTSSSK